MTTPLQSTKPAAPPSRCSSTISFTLTANQPATDRAVPQNGTSPSPLRWFWRARRSVSEAHNPRRPAGRRAAVVRATQAKQAHRGTQTLRVLLVSLALVMIALAILTPSAPVPDPARAHHLGMRHLRQPTDRASLE